MNRSVIGNTMLVNCSNRIWFTARLLIFDYRDLNPDDFNKPKKHFTLEWRNSISSSALRTFTGIAFPEDSTWTLYEDHKTGHRLVIFSILKMNK